MYVLLTVKPGGELPWGGKFNFSMDVLEDKEGAEAAVCEYDKDFKFKYLLPVKGHKGLRPEDPFQLGTPEELRQCIDT